MGRLRGNSNRRVIRVDNRADEKSRRRFTRAALANLLDGGSRDGACNLHSIRRRGGRLRHRCAGNGGIARSSSSDAFWYDLSASRPVRVAGDACRRVARLVSHPHRDADRGDRGDAFDRPDAGMACAPHLQERPLRRLRRRGLPFRGYADLSRLACLRRSPVRAIDVCRIGLAVGRRGGAEICFFRPWRGRAVCRLSRENACLLCFPRLHGDRAPAVSSRLDCRARRRAGSFFLPGTSA